MPINDGKNIEPIHDAGNDGYIYTRQRRDGGTFKVWISGTSKAASPFPVESIFESISLLTPNPRLARQCGLTIITSEAFPLRKDL
jgi:hypothetical protein